MSNPSAKDVPLVLAVSVKHSLTYLCFKGNKFNDLSEKGGARPRRVIGCFH